MMTMILLESWREMVYSVSLLLEFMMSELHFFLFIDCFFENEGLSKWK